MKNLFALLLVIGAYSGIKAQNNLKFSGQITNPNTDKVYLYTESFENRKYSRNYLDSASLNGEGAFSLSLSIDSTTKAVFYDGEESMDVLLSPNDDISLSLNTLFFDETLSYSGKGSDKNNAIVALYLVNEINNLALNGFFNSEDIDTTKLFQFYDENDEKYGAIIKDYIASIPNFKSHGETLLENQKRNTSSFKKYIRSEVEFKAKMKDLLGKQAFDFEGVNIKGKASKLSDYKGKITVVDFWATWCGPCKREFPAYKALEEKYGNDVNFVSVAVWCKEDEWREMAKNEGFKHNIYVSRDKEDQIKGYMVKSIPRYIVLDENFNIIDADAPRPSSGELEKYWLK